MKYTSRSKWGARRPKSSPARITRVKGIAVHWNGPKMGITSHDQCATRLRSVQNHHMNTNGWNDIAYSWFVCPHGEIFEGRGWGARTAAQGTNQGNSHYHAVYYLGGQGDPLTADGQRGLKTVIDESRKRYGNEVRPHSYFKNTSCPGNELRNWIKGGLKVTETSTPTPVKPAPADKTPSLLRVGSKGSAVEDLQRALNRHGAKLTVDGDFGPKTEAAVRSFQGDKKLAVDGIVGPATRAELAKNPPAPAPTPKKEFEFRYAKIVKDGESGYAVREWQNALRQWNRGALPRFGADGDFGAETADWTKRFQQAAKVSVDGIVGPKTRAAMVRALS